MDNQSEPTALDTVEAASLFAQMLDPATDEVVDDKKTPAEASAEPAEAAVETTETTEPEMVEVDIDGYKVQVPKDKAAKLEAERMMQPDYTKKTMQAAEVRKAAEAEIQKAQQERAQNAQNLQRLQAQLEGVLQEQAKSVNWQDLLENNPVEYLKQRHLADTRQAALQQVRQQQEILQSQFAAEQRKAFESHIQQQQEELLAKLPEWKDDAKAKAEKSAIKEYLKSQGYEDQAVSNITDAKAVVLARKAMLYDQLMSKAQVAAKKVATLPTKVERPGAGDAPNLDRRTAAYQKLSKSGRVEDAAAVFASLL